MRRWDTNKGCLHTILELNIRLRLQVTIMRRWDTNKGCLHTILELIRLRLQVTIMRRWDTNKGCLHTILELEIQGLSTYDTRAWNTSASTIDSKKKKKLNKQRKACYQRNQPLLSWSFRCHPPDKAHLLVVWRHVRQSTPLVIYKHARRVRQSTPLVMYKHARRGIKMTLTNTASER
jgi:hypothetical protein